MVTLNAVWNSNTINKDGPLKIYNILIFYCKLSFRILKKLGQFVVHYRIMQKYIIIEFCKNLVINKYFTELIV